MRGILTAGALALLCSSCVRPYYYLPTAPPLAFVRADEALRHGQYAQAEEGFMNFLATGSERDYRPRAFYQLAQTQYALGDYKAALESLSLLRREFPANDWPQVSVLRGDLNYALDNRVDAVLDWDTAWFQLPVEAQDLLVPRLEQAIGELSEQETLTLAGLVVEPEVRAMLPGSVVPRLDTADTIRAGAVPSPGRAAANPSVQGDEQYLAGNRVDALLYWESGWVHGDPAERDLLRPRMERAIREASDGEIDLLGQLLTEPAVVALLPPRAAAAPAVVPAPVPPVPASAEPPPGKARIAALLALTGPNRVQGRSALRGLRLALADVPESLVVRDTGSDARLAADLMASLATEIGVVAVIGALDRTEAEAAARSAEQLRLPLILLSHQPGIGGRFVVQTGVSAEQTVAATVSHARQQLGARRFAMLYPDDAYGRSFREPFRQEVLRQDGVVVGISSYAAGAVRAESAVRAVQGWLRSGTLDAIFIPDSASRAAALARAIRGNAPATVFLGTEAWNDPAAVAAGGDALDGSVFADSFHAAGVLPSTREFVDRFERVNGQPPTVLEAAAYDAAMLLRRLIAEGAGERQAMVDALRASRTFEGAGRLRTSAAGPQADLFLLGIRQGQVVEVSAVQGR